ncbi:MAG: DUF2171 domain-containing protein [Bosea sp. (in: a-proteobacteria)]|nr:MAG: DUF2171 domain-containing protein [Bosea sp. (in: a-proteobacteria)]
MMFVEQIREGLQVVGSDERPIGTVEAIVGQLLRIRDGDPATEGSRHFLDLAFVVAVDGNRVRLLLPAAEAKERWSAESD